MKLKLNISPCPNDTFMFDALVNGRIDTGDVRFGLSFYDIEELNRLVLDGGPDISKVSAAVLPAIADRYKILTSGGALGRGNGPLLVAREGIDTSDSPLRIAVPGEHTTANLLMKKLFPRLKNRTPVLFSQIAERVCSGEFDAGVLIHEGRFTYADKGLALVADLGAEWERRTSLPLPLGAIVVSRRLSVYLQDYLNTLLRQSIWHAFQCPDVSRSFVRSHARELDQSVIESHIKLFVNDFSIDLGNEGRQAVTELTGLKDNDIFV